MSVSVHTKYASDATDAPALMRRFLKKVELPGHLTVDDIVDPVTGEVTVVDTGDECWLWGEDHCIAHGYGYFWDPTDDKMKRANRWAWRFFRGAVPSTKHVLHKCPGKPNRRCVNPNHLALGTMSENMRDAYRNGELKAKLSPDDVREIRARAAAGEPQVSIAEDHPVNQSMICMVVNRQQYAWVDDEC